MTTLPEALSAIPFIAILRGITPKDVLAVGDVLVEAGIRAIEVPMNSPDPLASIALLSERYGQALLIGSGTVTTADDLHASYDAGSRLVLHPHADAQLVILAKTLGMVSVPGVATPTEAFAMLAAGADALKFFPSEIVSPAALAAMLAVLPKQTFTISVGGISAHNIPEYWRVGVSGFGLGSGVYRPGWSAAQVATAIEPLIAVTQGLSSRKKVGTA